MQDKLQKHKKIFGIGLSKTGTTSLCKALEMLGIKTIHYPSDERTLNELIEGNYNLSILNSYQAIVDTPVVPFYPQLDKAFPNSKFILTVREINSWIDSIRRHWAASYNWLDLDIESKNFEFFIRACVYGTIEFNQDRFEYVYNQHYKNVVDYFNDQTNKLLIMDISSDDGWGELCPFLGIPILNVPFPHLNSRNDVDSWVYRVKSLRSLISKKIPTEVPFIFVDDDKISSLISSDRFLIPFLEKDGKYWGPPPNDKIAISELERLRNSGARFIVFTWPSFWWFEYYSEFYEYLRSKFKCVLETDDLTIFNL